MKLLTNENNPEAVKVLIAGELSEKKINVYLVKAEYDDNVACPKRLPQLVLDSGSHLFSSNASIMYLLPPSENVASVNYYLDLEANVIQPLVSYCSGKIDLKLKSSLEEVLNKVDAALTDKKYLAGEKLSAADVSIWSTLYPLATDSKYSKEYFSCRNSVKSWFERIHKLPAILSAIKVYPLATGNACLTSMCSVHWFPDAHVKQDSAGFPPQIDVSESGDDGGRPKDTAQPVTEEELKSAAAGWLDKTGGKLRKEAVHPVLPVPGERNILITSALPYVNNVPHLGNIIGCVLSGDVFARYCRLRNYNTLYICGTDEYGTATETKALEEGLTPKQICDKYFEIHNAIYKWFNIKFDLFGRTTTPEQKELCQDLFLKLYNGGYVSSMWVEQLLCEKCDRYLADRFVEGTCPKCAYTDARGDQCDGCGHLINATELINPRCKVCQDTPVLQNSQQFFLDLPKIEPELKKWMEKSYTTWSHNAREISKAWINDGLKPRCITRDLKWGIPVPLEGFEKKVFYVWFDAPIGYMSITKQYSDQWKKWWMPDDNADVNLYQFMAKDNVPFHSVMFPATLIGSHEKFVLVDNIFATEYLNYEDGKFSKSRGVGVFGNDAQDTGISADIWRFYLLYVRPESQDSCFSWHDLALKNNSELLNILGNFINRALVFVEKNYDSTIPEMNMTDGDYELIALVNRELTGYITVLEKGKLREGIRHILTIARVGNQLMQSSQPWVLYKGTPEEKKRARTIIGLCANLSCLLSVLLHPYMPDTSDVIQKQLNIDSVHYSLDDRFGLFLQAGHKIGKPSPLFTKIEASHIEKLKSQFSGRQKSQTPDKKEAKASLNASADGVSNVDVASLEAVDAAQGNRMRKMKADGKEKSECLMKAEKDLVVANANVQNATSPTVNSATPATDTAGLEKAIEEQGNVVRKLKGSGVERAQWQPELNKLLDLKKQLADLKGEPMTNATSKKGKKK